MRRVRDPATALIGAVLACGWPLVGLGQEPTGSAWAAVGGGALGLFSSATLANAGSLVPCTQSYPGPRCVRWSSYTGGAIGLTGGIMLGAADSEQLGDRAFGAAVGFVAGGLAGVVLQANAQRAGGEDVLAMALVGAAIGAAPIGSALGLAAGGLVGGVLWLTLDGFRSPDAVGATVAGMALGGIAEWLVRGIDAQSRGAPELTLTVPLRVGF